MDERGGKKLRLEDGMDGAGKWTEVHPGGASGAMYFRWDEQDDDGWECTDEHEHDQGGDGDNWGEDGDDGQDGAQDQEGEAEEESPEEALEAASERALLRREVFLHSKKTKGKNHSHTRVAYADLLAAEKEERALKGPKPYWQEGRKDERRKQVLRRQLEKLDAEYEEAKERFEQHCYEYEERQQERRDAIKDAEKELEEIRRREEAYAKVREGESGRTNGGEAPDRLIHETAGRLAGIIEAAGDEKLKEALTAISASLGAVQHMLRGNNQEDRGKGGGVGSKGIVDCDPSEQSHGRWHDQG